MFIGELRGIHLIWFLMSIGATTVDLLHVDCFGFCFEIKWLKPGDSHFSFATNKIQINTDEYYL